MARIALSILIPVLIGAGLAAAFAKRHYSQLLADGFALTIQLGSEYELERANACKEAPWLSMCPGASSVRMPLDVPATPRSIQASRKVDTAVGAGVPKERPQLASITQA